MIYRLLQEPIREYLIGRHTLQGELLSCIPITILLHHYVEFRLILRRLGLISDPKAALTMSIIRLLLKVQQEVATEESNQNQSVPVWSEFVYDLWNNHLPHLREELYGDGQLAFNPSTGYYGFQEENEDKEVITEESTSLFVYT